jgi:hypothetical protein
MSTRCRIGIQNNDGTITSIYCHHDGYPSGVGDVLINCYTTEEKIRKLLELGDMSSIGTEPVDNPRAWESPSMAEIARGDYFAKWKEIHPDDMCDTYKSRGEDCPAHTHKDIKEYQAYSRDCWGEYTYLFKDGKWFVLEYDEPELKSVQEVLDNPDDEEDE